jgi:phosphate transport system protein
MERRFEHELESLKTSVIKMASIVEDHVRMAVEALLTGHVELAQQVIAGDNCVDSLEIENDHAIIDLFALSQPVASDLRFLVAAQKINNDLERVGDHAVNIAESVQTFSVVRGKLPFLHIPEMSAIARSMLKDAIDSFIGSSPDLARAVLVRDDEIDHLNRAMAHEALSLSRENPEHLEMGFELIRVSRNLERIGDLSTNIAEEVVFLTQARMVKHQAEKRPPASPSSSH